MMKRQLEVDTAKALDLSTTQQKQKRKSFVLPNFIKVLTSDPPTYRCTICKRTFRYKLQSKYHESCLTGKRPLSCHLCEKTFINKSHLNYHVLSHSGEKPFKCLICDKRFLQRGKLKRHQKSHSADRPYKCEVCSKTFPGKSALRVHTKTHTGERPFQCDSCQMSFSNKTHLARHRVFKHTAVRNFVCETCGKRFKLKWMLTHHRRTHSGYRPHECRESGCAKAFTTKKDLLRHIQTHSEVRYECSECITAFSRKDNLERHVKNTHPETLSNGRPQQIVSICGVDDFLSTEKQKVFTKFKDKLKLINTGSDRTKQVVHQTAVNIEENNLRKDEQNLYNTKDKVQAPGTMKSLIGDNSSLVNRVVENNDKMVVGHHSSNGENFSSELSLNAHQSSVIIVPQSVATKSTHKEVENVPKSQTVSVISSTKKIVKDDLKTNVKSSSNKKSDGIAPYRLITPRLKSLDSDGQNCVPTITKVTHIVHTSGTGVPNIQTVITTRDVPKERTKQQKEPNGLSNDKAQTPPRNQNRLKSVIKFIPKNSKSDNEKLNKCYRILNRHSEFITASSSLKNGLSFSNDLPFLSGHQLNVPYVGAGIDQQQYSDPSVQLSFGNAFSNLCKELLSEEYVMRNRATPTPPVPLLNPFNPSYDSSYLFNNGFDRSHNHKFPSNYELYNSPGLPSRRFQPYETTVSESCLLADNALDDSITDSLYGVGENDRISENKRTCLVGRINNHRETFSTSNREEDDSYRARPVELYSDGQSPYSHPLSPDKLEQEDNSSLGTEAYDYNHISDRNDSDFSNQNFLENSRSLNRRRCTGEPLLGRDLSSLEYERSNSGLQKNSELRNCTMTSSSMLGVVDHNCKEVGLAGRIIQPPRTRNPWIRSPSENNGLSTLADMACARASNLVDLPYA